MEYHFLNTSFTMIMKLWDFLLNIICGICARSMIAAHFMTCLAGFYADCHRVIQSPISGALCIGEYMT